MTAAQTTLIALACAPTPRLQTPHRAPHSAAETRNSLEALQYNNWLLVGSGSGGVPITGEICGLKSSQWLTWWATGTITESARSPQWVALEGTLYDRREPNERVDINVTEILCIEPENH